MFACECFCEVLFQTSICLVSLDPLSYFFFISSHPIIDGGFLFPMASLAEERRVAGGRQLSCIGAFLSDYLGSVLISDF